VKELRKTKSPQPIFARSIERRWRMGLCQ